MISRPLILRLIFLAALPLASGSFAAADTFDLVLAGGRVMDPASGLDATRHVGIRGGKIAAISEQPLAGSTVINVAGYVVAPGFIDLHVHGFGPLELSLKVRDGVTTALELEHGSYPVSLWYERLTEKSPVNYGSAVGHMPARYAVFKPGAVVLSGSDLLGPAGLLPRASPEQVHAIRQALQRGLADGALAVGCGLEYTPHADPTEIEVLFRTAATAQVPIMVHTRASGLAAVTEAIDAARRAGTALHLFHLGSTGLGDLPEILELIDRHRATGMALTTEIYPYIAASSRIEGAMFNDGWQKRLQIDYPDLVWAATGERLTRESFDRYRPQGGRLIIFSMKEDNIQRAIAHAAVIVASDSVALSNGRGHPRGAGTFARVLGLYSREKKLLPLMEALAKMTILPARRLDHVPAMRKKGRIAVGADADLTVFDPVTVMDRATFENPTTPSTGIPFVVVNGTLVVRDGNLVPAAMAGRPVRNPVANPR